MTVIIISLIATAAIFLAAFVFVALLFGFCCLMADAVN